MTRNFLPWAPLTAMAVTSSAFLASIDAGLSVGKPRAMAALELARIAAFFTRELVRTPNQFIIGERGTGLSTLTKAVR